MAQAVESKETAASGFLPPETFPTGIGRCSSRRLFRAHLATPLPRTVIARKTIGVEKVSTRHARVGNATMPQKRPGAGQAPGQLNGSTRRVRPAAIASLGGSVV